ncbi:hypothetical protein CsatB_001531 [Cannabis sativa]
MDNLEERTPLISTKKDVEQILRQLEDTKYDMDTCMLDISADKKKLQILHSRSIHHLINISPVCELQKLQNESCGRLLFALEKEEYYIRFELIKLERDIMFWKWYKKYFAKKV